MTGTNQWPDTIQADPPTPRCPPCNGDCLHGRGCDAEPMIETPRGGLLFMAAAIVGLLAFAVLVLSALASTA